MDGVIETVMVESAPGTHALAMERADELAHDRVLAALDRWLRGMEKALARRERSLVTDER